MVKVMTVVQREESRVTVVEEMELQEDQSRLEQKPSQSQREMEDDWVVLLDIVPREPSVIPSVSLAVSDRVYPEVVPAKHLTIEPEPGVFVVEAVRSLPEDVALEAFHVDREVIELVPGEQWLWWRKLGTTRVVEDRRQPEVELVKTLPPQERGEGDDWLTLFEALVKSL
ncbi:uncharacterized protein [Salvelinus sp. IW2-2015]|uniref:uncharacterized protein isoform X1 n=1 Tax=Salvelinus sp. IW2-2015 TaxID=2691554 RepID=UPI0038D4BB7C